MASNSNPLELSLSMTKPCVPKTISAFLHDLNKLDKASDKLSMLNDLMQKHKEEMARIEASGTCQLPLTMMLLKDTMELLSEKNMKEKNGNDTEPEGLLMATSTLKRNGFEEKEGKVMEKYGSEDKDTTIQACNCRCKDCKRRGKEIVDGSSTLQLSPKAKIRRVESGNTNLKFDGTHLNHHPQQFTQPIMKNNRRSWSPELHARFVEALNILGGHEVATPKNIREVMQVEGLTTDQVKSHLQKYRLHCRALPVSNTNTAYQQHPRNTAGREISGNQFWMPTPNPFLNRLQTNEEAKGAETNDKGSIEGIRKCRAKGKFLVPQH